MSPNLPKPKGKKLTEESLHCCIVFKAKEEKQREGRETAEEKQRKAEEQQRKSRGKGKETRRTSKGNAKETLRKRKKIGGFEDWRIQGLKDSKILATLGTLTFILFVLLLRAPAQTTCMYTLQEKEYQKLLCKGEVLISV